MPEQEMEWSYTTGAAEEPPKGLYVKLAQVTAAVESVEKRGRNEHFKYDYATAEDTLRALRGPLAERNVVIMPSVLSSQREGNLTTVRLSFTLVDGDTGEAHVCEWEGTGEDRADKGHYKAYTGAIRTFLRETFLLPAGDDPEADKDTDKGKHRARPKPPPEPVGITLDQVRVLRKAVYESSPSPEELGLLLVAVGVDGGYAAANLLVAESITKAEAKTVAALLTDEEASAILDALKTSALHWPKDHYDGEAAA